MELDKKDLMAVARSRVQRGKLTLWLMGVGMLWLIGTLVGLYLCEYLTGLLYWMLASVVIFLLGMVAVLAIIEIRARKMFESLSKEVGISEDTER